MSWFEVAAILVVLTAILSFVNARYVRLPSTIGVMLISLVLSLLVATLGSWFDQFRQHAATFLGAIDFEHALLHGMLAFLLFAGALHLDFNDLLGEWGSISLLAIVGTVLSTFAIGLAFWCVSNWTGGQVPMIDCMLFGALISPTDPVAVIGILKSAGAPRRLDALMAGESLFNDGIGVVIFLTMLDVAVGTHPATAWSVTSLLLREVGGAAVLGVGTGMIALQLIRRVEEYQTEILLTLALAMGGYVLAEACGASAPITVVISGLIMGNQGRKLAMSPRTVEHLDMFWELLDGILNAVLFVLIGLEVLVTPMRAGYLAVGAVTIGVALLVRWASVAGIIQLARLHRKPEPGTISVLTWGGLRGGISVAMALSLPENDHRNLILAVTYCVVVFSVLVQGLTVRGLILRVCSNDQSVV